MSDPRDRSPTHPERAGDRLASLAPILDREPPRWAGPLALLALALAGYGFLLFDPARLATAHSDIVAFHLSLQQALYDSLRAFHAVPLWQWDHAAGGPALTNPQALYFFPTHVFFWLLAPARAFGLALLADLLLGALGGWALGAALGLRFWPRLFVATAVLFLPRTILALYAGWLAPLSTIALLPWLLWATLRLGQKPGLRSMLAMSAVLALAFLSGAQQLVLYLLYFCSAWLALRRGALRWFAPAIALGLLCAAFQLVPFLANRSLYARGALGYDAFLAGHGSARALLTLFWPDALGTPLTNRALELWEDSAHFGFAALLLALAGMFHALRPPRRAPPKTPQFAPRDAFARDPLEGGPALPRETQEPGPRTALPREPAHQRALYLALTIGFCASLALAVDTPLLRALHAVLPGMQLFRIPSRFFALSSLFGVSLAGLALARLRALGPIAVLLAAAQGIFMVQRYFAQPQPGALAPRAEYAALTSDGMRVAPVGRATINTGWSETLGLQLVTSYDPLALRHYQRFLSLLAGVNEAHGNWTEVDRIARRDLLDVLAVRWVVAPAAMRVPPPLTLAARFTQQPEFVFYAGMRKADLAVWRNPGARPFAWLAEEVRIASGAEDAERLLGEIDARSVAVVESGGNADAIARSGGADAGDLARVEERRPGALSIETRAQRSRLLVVSEIWHPGWTALIDGAPAEVLRADVALMALWIPPGEHRVSLRFSPPGLRLGLWLTALGLFLCAALSRRAVRRIQER